MILFLISFLIFLFSPDTQMKTEKLKQNKTQKIVCQYPANLNCARLFVCQTALINYFIFLIGLC